MNDIKIKLELDQEANAAYIELSDGAVVRTCAVNREVNVDLDVNDVVVGIETLRVNAPIPFEDLKTHFHVRSEVLEALQLVRPNPSAFFEFCSCSDGVSSASTLQSVSDCTEVAVAAS
jgi:uncharacterized protein YuzE